MDCKQKSLDTKKHENAIHIQQKSNVRWPTCWDWQAKALKAAIINMSKILIRKMFKKLKGNIALMSKQIENINRENYKKESSRSSFFKRFF